MNNDTVETLNENQNTEPTVQAPVAPVVDLAAMLAGKTPGEQLAFFAEIQAAQKAAIEAARLEKVAQFNRQLDALNDILAEDESAIFLDPEFKIQLRFVAATAETKAHWEVVNQVAVKAAEVATQARRQTVQVRVARRGAEVDGQEFANYNSAYHQLGYDHPGYSFNARTELMKLGHVCGPATR